MVKALKKLDFEIQENFGKGSHIKVKDPISGLSTTIPRQKDLTYVRNEIVKYVENCGRNKKDLIKYL